MTEPTTAPPSALLIGTPSGRALFPRLPFETLSEDARHVHRYGRDVGMSTGRLDRDLFDKKALRGYVTQEAGRKFEPTNRMLAAIAELVAAGYATYSPQWKSLRITRVHERYTIARGRGHHIIEISTFGKYPEDSRLLAVLIGGDIESRDPRRDLVEYVLRARHENAVDSSHHASSTAYLVVRNLSQPVFDGYGGVSYTGVLTEANLYPLGVDPLTQTDADTSRSGEICTQCDETHPYAPWMPPDVVELTGATFVKIQTRPYRPTLVHDPDQPIEPTEEDDA